MNEEKMNAPCAIGTKGAVTTGSEQRVPIHLKLTLTIKEAAEYSNIGINKIDTMLKQPNCPFVLYVGTRKLVKRREFEEYIRREGATNIEIEKTESLCYNICLHWTLF